MTAPTDRLPVEVVRMSAHLVPPVEPTHHEIGWYQETRRLARALRDAVKGESWEAFAVERRRHFQAFGTETQQVVTVDDKLLIVVTHLCPPMSTRDRWSITLNGQPVAHRVYAGAMPWQVEAVAASVYRHVNLYTVVPCDSLMCREQPVYAMLDRSAYCAKHVDLYA